MTTTKGAAGAVSRVDPITTEIIRSAFISCAQDMNATLIRSAYTPIIYEGKDCSVALLDENGDVLGQSLGLPLFLGNLEVCVKLTAALFGWDAFKPGDLFYMNDAYMTGTHLNDATIFGPIHWRGRLVGFSATRAHWLDVGAKDPGGAMDSHEIYQEGMRWGPTRIYENGAPRDDVIDLLRRNSRFGPLLIGDMNAQVAACRTGEARFRTLLDRFGYETYLAARDEIFRQSEQLEREAVGAIPDGTFKTLTVQAPAASIFQAQEPAACQWYFTPLGLLIDLIVTAVAPALPDAVAGAHYGDSMVIYFAGRDPRRGNAPFLSIEPTPGGWGAFQTGDGQDGLINNVNGAFKDLPVEVYENKYPIMIKEYGFRPDTGGPGRFRGGCGIYRMYHLEVPAAAYFWFDRSVTPAWGLFGGRDAVGPDIVVNPGKADERHMLKANALQLSAGAIVRTQTGGGGGYGPPWKRDVARVVADVVEGYITRRGAERDYGVVLRDDLSVDEQATQRRRPEMESVS